MDDYTALTDEYSKDHLYSGFVLTVNKYKSLTGKVATLEADPDHPDSKYRIIYKMQASTMWQYALTLLAILVDTDIAIPDIFTDILFQPWAEKPATREQLKKFVYKNLNLIWYTKG